MRATLIDFLNKESSNLPVTFEGTQALREYRLAAWQSAVGLPFPGKKDEAWRRISLDGVLNTPLEFLAEKRRDLNAVSGIAEREAASYAGSLFSSPLGSHSQLDPALVQAGVIFRDFADVERETPELLAETSGKLISPTESKFAAAASALADFGVVLHVPAGCKIERPLLARLGAGRPANASFSHSIIKLQAGASALLVLDFVSETNANSTKNALHIGILEVILEEGAELSLVELQRLEPTQSNITFERAALDSNARLHWVYSALGAGLSKNFIETSLIGEGAEVKMHGLYFTGGDQVLDLDTQQNHLAPHTTSDLLYKGAAVGKSRTVWEGMIYVDPKAMQTDGYQTNRNLVLSPNAEVSVLPGLEILADDVRCSHGATIGKLDEDELFYLQTRGIPRVEAEQLIMEGFFGEIIEQVPIPALQTELKEILSARFILAE